MFDFFRSHMKLFMGALFIPLVIGFVLFGVQGYERFSEGDDAVAQVGGTSISRQEFDRLHRNEIERRLAASPGLDRALLESDAMRQALLERTVGERVLALAAQKAPLATTDQRLARELMQDPSVAAMRTPDGKLDLQRYEQALRAQGLSPELYENSLRQDIARRQLLQAVGDSELLSAAAIRSALDPWFARREIQVARFAPAEFSSMVQVSDADLQAYYQAHLAQFQSPEQVDIEYLVLDLDAVARRVALSESELRAYYDQNAARDAAAKEQRRASHILLTLPAGAAAEEKARVMEKARALLAELRKSPARFAELAKANSQDPGSAAKGGDLDYFARGAMVKPVEDAVFALAKGQISDIVESEFGLHIIELTDIRRPAPPSFESQRAQIEQQLRRQQAQKAWSDAAEQFSNLVYEQADSLKPAADKLGLSVSSAKDLQRSGAAAGADLLANPKLLKAVFADESLRSRRNTEAIELGGNQLVAARVLQHRPAAQRALAEVAPQVRQQLVQQRALELATAQGKSSLEAWKGGAAAALPAAQVVSRQQPQGLPQPLIAAALSAPLEAGKAAWVGVDLGAQGYAVVRVNRALGREAPSPEQVRQEGQQLAQFWARAEAQAYLQTLKNRYKAKIFLKPEKT